MKAHTHQQDSLVIVYDADCIDHPGVHLFDPDFWEQQGAVSGEAIGRGRVMFLETEFGPAVLRQYLRGGLPARFSRDRYLFSGFESSRPMLEFHLLEKVSAAGLPVPEPLAAMCLREDRYYTGWLMTRRLINVEPLVEVIGKRSEDPGFWRDVGSCIRRFHDFGLDHADLNARNILVGENGSVHLVDLDRSRLRKNDHRAFRGNLKRLHRSLRKLWPKPLHGSLGSCWSSLLEGYERGTAGR